MQTILANSSLLRDTNNRTAIKISGRGSDGGGLDGGAMHSPLKLSIFIYKSSVLWSLSNKKEGKLGNWSKSI